MKQIIVFLSVLMLSVHASAQSGQWQKGVSVLKPGIGVLLPTHGYRLIPFIDLETHKVGFLSSSSSLGIVIPPTYEEAFLSTYMLMPAQKDGKWGVIDLGARFSFEGHSYTDPIVPCIYDNVEVVDDDHVRVFRNGKSRIVDVSDESDRFNLL